MKLNVEEEGFSTCYIIIIIIMIMNVRVFVIELQENFSIMVTECCLTESCQTDVDVSNIKCAIWIFP